MIHSVVELFVHHLAQSGVSDALGNAEHMFDAVVVEEVTDVAELRETVLDCTVTLKTSSSDGSRIERLLYHPSQDIAWCAPQRFQPKTGLTSGYCLPRGCRA